MLIADLVHARYHHGGCSVRPCGPLFDTPPVPPCTDNHDRAGYRRSHRLGIRGFDFRVVANEHAVVDE